MPPTFQPAGSRVGVGGWGGGKWVVCMLSHMSRDHTMKQKPSAHRNASCGEDEMDAPEPESTPAPSQFGVNGSLNCEFRSWTVGTGLGGGRPGSCKKTIY